MSGSWICRFVDEDGDDPAEEVERIVTEALAAVGYRVRSVHRPMRERNPEPLRVIPAEDRRAATGPGGS